MRSATVCLILLSLVAAAHADKIAIIEIEISGDAAPELAAPVAGSIATGLAAEGAEVVTLEDVRVALRDTPELVGCTSTTCLARIGEKLGASRFVRATIDGTGAAYSLVLFLMSADETDGIVKRVDELCAGCTVTEVNELATKTAARLLSEDAPAGLAVVIATAPPGANILVDGNSVGTSPYTGRLAPGPHTVSARLDGYLETQKQVTVTANATAAQNFELSLTPAPAIPEQPERGPRYRVWKWVAGSGAVVWLASGIALIAIDGNQTCDRALVDVPGGGQVQGQCPEVYDTALAGVLSVGVGVGLGAASGWMFYKDHQTQTAVPSASIRPTHGGGVATLRWTF